MLGVKPVECGDVLQARVGPDQSYCSLRLFGALDSPSRLSGSIMHSELRSGLSRQRCHQTSVTFGFATGGNNRSFWAWTRLEPASAPDLMRQWQAPRDRGGGSEWCMRAA